MLPERAAVGEVDVSASAGRTGEIDGPRSTAAVGSSPLLPRKMESRLKEGQRERLMTV